MITRTAMPGFPHSSGDRPCSPTRTHAVSVSNGVGYLAQFGTLLAAREPRQASPLAGVLDRARFAGRRGEGTLTVTHLPASLGATTALRRSGRDYSNSHAGGFRILLATGLAVRSFHPLRRPPSGGSASPSFGTALAAGIDRCYAELRSDDERQGLLVDGDDVPRGIRRSSSAGVGRDDAANWGGTLVNNPPPRQADTGAQVPGRGHEHEGNVLPGLGRRAGALPKLLKSAGAACAEYQDRTPRNLPCRPIQMDEAWQFV